MGGPDPEQGGPHPGLERLGRPPRLHAARLEQKYPEFYRQLTGYQKKGRNKHDDAPDVLAAIYERVANPQEIEVQVRTL